MGAKRKNTKISKRNSVVEKTNKGKNVKLPFILFGVSLTFIMALFFWFYNQPFFDKVNMPIVKGYAWMGHNLLNLLGQGTSWDNTVISSDIFSIDISKGCDAVTPTMLFIVAVLVFPVRFMDKVPALLIAPPALALLNLVRIISLFLIGVYAPSLFEFAHIELWQVVFIIVCFVGWVYWLVWANKKKN